MRVRTLARPALFALALCLALPARLQAAPTSDAEFHCPAAGTFVRYDSGATLKVTGGSSFRCSYTDQTGAAVEKFAGFGDDAAFLDAGLSQLWPLRLRTEQTMSVPTNAGPLGYSAPVERFAVLTREKIAVPAGTFDTIVVEQEETASGPNGYDAKRTYWYAPDLGVIVKSAFTSIREPRFALSMPARLLPGDYAAVRIEVAGQVIAGTAQRTPASAAPTPTSQRPTAATTVSAEAIAARLRTLKDLLDQKLITDQEYRAKRKAILELDRAGALSSRCRRSPERFPFE